MSFFLISFIKLFINPNASFLRFTNLPFLINNERHVSSCRALMNKIKTSLLDDGSADLAVSLELDDV